MTNARKRNLLKSLGRAIEKTLGDCYTNPMNYYDDDSTPVLAWEGPQDWTMITAGSSIFAGEFGDYSTPIEARIQKVIDRIENADGNLEALNHFTIAIY